ncbi:MULTISPECIES: GNAT family N-acetyltransferase [Kitasatospora]|uniref:GNAT family N-acetyltransferase n=1 Tax=Kitasatospora cystarginea TaxID=58350 RepID=A0ABP5R6C1_9ACTN
MRIRTGGPDDLIGVLGLLDGAVAWLASLGRTGQWGDQPWSSRPTAVERVRSYAGDADTFLLRIAEAEDGTVVGSCVLSEQATDYATVAGERELYIRNLVTDRSRKGSGIGAALVADALEEARRRGIALVRVDCYADGDRRLVGQYQKLGFTPTDAFEVAQPNGPWRGQILEIRI